MGLRQFLSGGTPELLVEILVKLDEWAASVLNKGVDSALGEEAPDVISLIAKSLTVCARGIQRDLLSKSIQESLFYSTGTQPHLSRAEFEYRLKRYLRRWGTAGLLRQFLSLHIFNAIWFQSGEAFRASTASNDTFISDMETLERTSKRIVQATFRKMHYPLTPSLAEQLITEIKQKLEV